MRRGFIQIEDEGFADAANAGLLDIVLALEWIRGNIAAFGGSPDNVTIFGESGGASKVAALCTMPRAKGLFHKAIVQSSVSGVTLATIDEAQENARRLAQALSLHRPDGSALQGVPLEAILKAGRQLAVRFRGTVDGRHLFAHPLVSDTAAPPIPADVPMMLGYTSAEASFFFPHHPKIFDIDWDEEIRRLASYLAVGSEASRPIVESFRARWPQKSAGEILIQVVSAYMFERNTLKLADRRFHIRNSDVFVYRFDHPSTIFGGRLGAPHTGELPFIFGTLDSAQAIIGSSDSHASMSRTMMRTWGAFARTSHPGNDDLPDWPAYDPARPLYMNLGQPSELVSLEGDPVFKAFEDLPYIESGRSRVALFAG